MLAGADDTSKFMNTYGRFAPTLVRGEGCRVWDESGKEYIDLLAGIAVVALGHCHPATVAAITTQAQKLIHVSNYFWNEPNLRLASHLQRITGDWGQAFFCNSGTEANEAAIKLARKWGFPNKHTIISTNRGFHGRTLGALAATGQPDKWKGFEPLPKGFVHADYNDVTSFHSLVDDSTAAILVETIQGEGGVVPATSEFLEGLRALCDEKEILLIFDEIQCGMGRTGEWWGFQSYGVIPDIFTSAKGLGGGLPIGCCIAADWVAASFAPGDHGTTFGGNPVACAAANAVIETIEKDSLLAHVQQIAPVLQAKLAELPGVLSIRGRGLMLAAELDGLSAKEVMEKAFAHGLLVNAVTSTAIRIVPPLTIAEDDVEIAISRLKLALEEVAA